MKKAVLFLIFNRLDTTKVVFESIRKAKPPRLYVASDGPRDEKNGERENVIAVKEYVLRNVDWNCEIKTLFREKNLGCRMAVSEAISWFFDQENDGIILEDDCLPSQSFFSYCEELLDRYKDHKEIMHISGDQFIPNFDNEASYYFSKIMHCWGWASWSDRWEFYGDNLHNYDEKNIEKFSDDKNVQEFWMNILHKMKKNEIDSWAYQWAFRIVEKNGLCINPSKNLVSNIGFSGTHYENSAEDSNLNKSVFEIEKIIHPKKINIDQFAVDLIYRMHYGIKIDMMLDNYPHRYQLMLLEENLNVANQKLTLAKSELILLKSELDAARSEIRVMKEKLNFANEKIEVIESQLSSIHNSYEWKLALKLQAVLKLLFSIKSIRRVLKVSFQFIKIIIRLFYKIKLKINEVLFFFKVFLLSIKPKKKRKINLKSKKIVYIGHSYHNKTKSTGFLIDYLKEFFDVEVVLDESWRGGPIPDLSFIDERYLGVIFFQRLPSEEIIKNIKNDNIIYFPMYDQSGALDYNYWRNYKNLKIINFSNTLYKKLKKWRFETIYVQYFPVPQKFKPGKKDEVFFWQRLTKINISTIINLLKGERVKIHIHKAVDPDQEFVQPSNEEEKKYHITYSDWFETREEMWKAIKQRGIYIAPRELEGIGMSFLEAMAMGKTVVAVNNPTMNEYITHGKTGYLYDLDNIKKIDLFHIENVQKNTYKYMREGYKKWQKDKKKIIEFIKSA